MNGKTWAAVAGALALVVGAALPWVSWVGLWGEEARGTERLAIGWEGDGTITAICGLIIALVALRAQGKAGVKPALLIAIPALIAVLVVIGGVVRIAEIGPEAGILATVRVGLVVTAVGALAGLAGGVLLLPLARRA